MNVRHLLVGLLFCAALQACTTPPPPPPPPAPPPPVAQPAPLPMPAPNAVAPAAAPAVVEAPRDPVVDPRGLCDGRAEGDRIQTRGPGGESLTGVCLRGANGWLKFSPNGRR